MWMPNARTHPSIPKSHILQLLEFLDTWYPGQSPIKRSISNRISQKSQTIGNPIKNAGNQTTPQSHFHFLFAPSLSLSLFSSLSFYPEAEIEVVGSELSILSFTSHFIVVHSFFLLKGDWIWADNNISMSEREPIYIYMGFPLLSSHWGEDPLITWVTCETSRGLVLKEKKKSS